MSGAMAGKSVSQGKTNQRVKMMQLLSCNKKAIIHVKIKVNVDLYSASSRTHH